MVSSYHASNSSGMIFALLFSLSRSILTSGLLAMLPSPHLSGLSLALTRLRLPIAHAAMLLYLPHSDLTAH